MDEIIEEGNETQEVLNNPAQDQDQDLKSFFDQWAPRDPHPNIGNYQDFRTVPETDATNTRKAQVTTENSSPNYKQVFVARKSVLVCLKVEHLDDPIHEMARRWEDDSDLLYEAIHRRRFLSAGNKIFTSTPMVLVGPRGEELLYVEAGQLKDDKVAMENSSPNDKPLCVVINNVLKVWNGIQTVDHKMIPQREHVKLMYEAEHRRQSLLVGNKIFTSIPMVLVGPRGKEVLFVRAGGQYNQNNESGGTNACLFSSVDLEANFIPPQQKDLSLKAYGSYLYNNMVNTPQKQLTVFGLIALLSGILVQPLGGTTVTNPLNFHVGNTTNTLLTSGEAILAHSSKLAYIILLLTCYIGCWMLVLLPIQSALQTGTTLLLVIMPFLYIFQLLFNASSSGVAVACGGLLNLPLTGFAVLGSFGIALILVLITLLINYAIWKFINKGDPQRA